MTITTRLIRSLFKTLVLAVVMLAMTGMVSHNVARNVARNVAQNVPQNVASQKPSGDVLASRVYLPEAHLRKLHLVRPDLIPYPIFFDIYC